MTIALTLGEPAGIGPDIVLLLGEQGLLHDCVIIGDVDLLRARAECLGVTFPFASHQLLHEPLKSAAEPGRLQVKNADTVLAWLDTAVQGCSKGEFDAMVTAPVQKSIIIEAGHDFTGHTEYLMQRCGAQDVVMLLVADQVRVALATTHLALRDVPDAITKPLLESRLRILLDALKTEFGINDPTVAVTGLNPHAGEAGHLGDEEITTIAPVCAIFRGEGFNLRGPVPADTLFTTRALEGVDAVLAMYHDQGLPALKALGFGEAVNVTLGLPIIRTSVDHGTALELAGTGQVDCGSMGAAVQLARQIVQTRASA